MLFVYNTCLNCFTPGTVNIFILQLGVELWLILLVNFRPHRCSLLADLWQILLLHLAHCLSSHSTAQLMYYDYNWYQGVFYVSMCLLLNSPTYWNLQCWQYVIEYWRRWMIVCFIWQATWGPRTKGDVGVYFSACSWWVRLGMLAWACRIWVWAFKKSPFVILHFILPPFFVASLWAI